MIQGFVARRGSVVLVPFEGCEHAFWKTRVYFREGGDDKEVEGEGGGSVKV